MKRKFIIDVLMEKKASTLMTSMIFKNFVMMMVLQESHNHYLDSKCFLNC